MEIIKKALILIVDDTPKNIQVLGSILHNKGYNICISSSGSIALEMVKTELPDLILLDIEMPGMDGFEVCKALKSNPVTESIPVIFLTAVSDPEKLLQGFELGAVDYITKPFNIPELTARVATHIEIKQSREKLLELNATKDKFFSIIAHDLRNPFTSLMLSSQFILRHLNNNLDVNMIEKKIQVIYKSSKQCSDLLENLLEWAETQTNKIKFSPNYHKIRDIIIKCIEISASQANNKNIEIINAIPDDISLMVDGNLFETIIRNLLTNAIKFTQEYGTITIKLKEEDHLTEISVTDTGIGIPMEVQSKLFRIDSHYMTQGTSKEDAGTGLGLILCREFVEKHGGNIWVESEIEKGSTFKFTIPQQIQDN
ncbi:MAG: hybrid sensor histidine kinase/response regulator [Candidatus Sericytochromatia bacterium]|nr:hybrid sensor histidine kinase/response regulator [Candidatus Sericytochromatia bacterium]